MLLQQLLFSVTKSKLQNAPSPTSLIISQRFEEITKEKNTRQFKLATNPPVQKRKLNQTKSMKHGLVVPRAMQHLIQITNPPSKKKPTRPYNENPFFSFPPLDPLSSWEPITRLRHCQGTGRRTGAIRVLRPCLWANSQGVWPRPRCASAQATRRQRRSRETSTPTRSALRSSGRPGPALFWASTSAPRSTRRCAASEWPRMAAPGRGV